jgi:hypothetical protein
MRKEGEDIVIRMKIGAKAILARHLSRRITKKRRRKGEEREEEREGRKQKRRVGESGTRKGHWIRASTGNLGCPAPAGARIGGAATILFTQFTKRTLKCP